MKRAAIASAGPGIVAGAVTLVVLRVGRAATDDGAVLAAALAAGLAAGAVSAAPYARRWGSSAWGRTVAALALLLALGRPAWSHLPNAIEALRPSLPTRAEQAVATAVLLLPLAALPAHWLARSVGVILARAPRGLPRAQAALMGALFLPFGGLLAWVAVAALDPRRALGLVTLALGAIALAADQGRSWAARGAAAATALLVVVG